MSDSSHSGDLEARIRSLYGDVDWPTAQGVLQVVAIAESPRCVIAIGPAAPQSPVDRFVLGLARARADVILSTGSILRSEPALVHCYAETESENTALTAWRFRELGRTKTPALVILSATGDFSLEHPALAAAGRGFIWTTEAGAARLGSPPEGFTVEHARTLDESGARGLLGAVARARERLGAESILVEAGPRASACLYEAPADGNPSPLDELLLSRFKGALATEAVGPDFVSERRIGARWSRARSVCEVHEASGLWHFERYRDDSTACD